MKTLVILGAGITGMTAASLLKDNYKVIVLEKTDRIGGLCDSFCIDGFWFDYGAHAAFGSDERVRSLMEENVQTEESFSEAMNYKSGCWIKHPVQNNLFRLETDEKISIIRDFVKREDDGQYRDYGEWLRKKYGDYFARHYPYLYTKKYWTVFPEEMGTKWIKQRMYTPSLEEILRGAFSCETPNVNYSGRIRYPERGGFSEFLKNVKEDIHIICDAEVRSIDAKRKTIEYGGGEISYDEIISTIPLPELVKLVKGAPGSLRESADALDYTSLILVSFGIKRKDIMPEQCNCFYVYDENKMVSRAFSTNVYGSKNAPDGCSSIQAEVYYSKYKKLDMSLQDVEQKVAEEFMEMGLFAEEDILVRDVRQRKYANIIFSHDIYWHREFIHNYLTENHIMYAGRFGNWDYLWSGQSMRSAIDLSEKILSQCE